MLHLFCSSQAGVWSALAIVRLAQEWDLANLLIDGSGRLVSNPTKGQL